MNAPEATVGATPTKTKAKVTGPTVGIEVIGPSEARYLLRLNTHNRHISEDRVRTMTRDMEAGKWILNGETIKVSADDKLLDGQHRLMAVIASKKQVAMTVVRDLPDSAQESVDLGAKRIMADVLTLAGEVNAHNLGAAVRLCWYLDTYGVAKAYGVNPSLAELREWLEANPDIRGSVPLGNRAGKSVIRYTPSVASALHYLMGKVDPDKRDDFWEDLIEGGLPGDPVVVLRESLLRDLSMPHRMSVSHRVAVTIKAWNATREGRTVQTIGFRGSGKGAESYPVIK